jgi:hypothetical protein
VFCAITGIQQQAETFKEYLYHLVFFSAQRMEYKRIPINYKVRRRHREFGGSAAGVSWYSCFQIELSRGQMGNGISGDRVRGFVPGSCPGSKIICRWQTRVYSQPRRLSAFGQGCQRLASIGRVPDAFYHAAFTALSITRNSVGIQITKFRPEPPRTLHWQYTQEMMYYAPTKPLLAHIQCFI